MVRGKATRTSASPFIAPSSETATQGVYILPGLEHPRDAAFDHRLHRRLAVEDRPAILQHGPAIGHGVGEEQVKPLEHADQRGGPGQLILAQHAVPAAGLHPVPGAFRSEEHTSELQSLMRISYAVFCLKKKKQP